MRESTLYFHGAAGMVTGSNFLLDTGGSKVLIDCGLMQGMGEEKNWEPFAYDPKEISHLIVTHAHLDHIGRIPRLVKMGFKGRIVSTKGTRSLVEPLLLDAMQILGANAERDGRDELFNEKDISDAMHLWDELDYEQKLPLEDGVELELLDAGHILGSAMIRLRRDGRSIVFSGDLGGGNSPLLPKKYEVTGASYLVMEGTYGDKLRPQDATRREQLENVIEDAMARGGTLLIPAFSTERTQDLMYEIRNLMVEKRVPQVPVFVDSPLAQKITRAFMAHPEYFAAEVQERLKAGEDLFAFPGLVFVEDMEASRKVKDTHGPKIILAGSGMSSGGRILAHEREFLPDPKSTLLIVGYQAAGTIGRRLIDGAKSIEFHKEKIPVRAKIETLYGYSAHADSEALLEYANHAAQHADGVFVVHAEPGPGMFLCQRIRDYLGVNATTPELGDKATLQF